MFEGRLLQQRRPDWEAALLVERRWRVEPREPVEQGRLARPKHWEPRARRAFAGGRIPLAEPVARASPGWEWLVRRGDWAAQTAEPEPRSAKDRGWLEVAQSEAPGRLAKRRGRLTPARLGGLAVEARSAKRRGRPEVVRDEAPGRSVKRRGRLTPALGRRLAMLGRRAGVAPEEPSPQLAAQERAALLGWDAIQRTRGSPCKQGRAGVGSVRSTLREKFKKRNLAIIGDKPRPCKRLVEDF